jgi:hypothetical protein
MKTAGILGLLILFLSPVVAAAQPSRDATESPATAGRTEGPSNEQPARSPSWYFGLTTLVSNISEGSDHCPYLCGKLGGRSVGGAFLVGAFIGSHASMEAEVSTGMALQSPASERIPGYLSGASRSFTASHRPTTVSFFVRARENPLRRGKTTVEVVGGLALELASQSQVDGIDLVSQGYGKPLVSVPTPESSHIEPTIGFGAGLDIVSSIRDRLALTAGARVYCFWRRQYDGSQDVPTPGPLTMQVRVGLLWMR